MDVTDTPGMRAAEAVGIAFEVARTERPSSAEESAALQGIQLGQLLRTIVIRRGADDYVFVLVPGGRQIDWPKLRSHLGVKRLSLPSADEARDADGIRARHDHAVRGVERLAGDRRRLDEHVRRRGDRSRRARREPPRRHVVPPCGAGRRGGRRHPPGRSPVYAVIRLRGTNLPCPGVPWNSPFSTST